MNEKNLGKRLQEARQAAGLTQQQLCQQANLSFSTLTKIERGAIKSPSIFTVQSIAGALHLSLDQLIGLTTPVNGRVLRKTKSGVSFVYFDVNGCLIRYYERAFAQLAAKFNVPADVIETAFWHYNDDACRGTMSSHDFSLALAARIGVPELDWKAEYLQVTEPMPEMQELLKWTADHYKTGLLTNITGGFMSGLRDQGKIPALPYDAVVDSSEIGSIKPESKIFEIAQARAGVPPSEILLIDDTRGNLNAAESFGWNVLWFDYARPEESVALIRSALEPAV
jgi:FMN phosphatase YigB (HAD superfamily)/DNA-binding XRE family transcriptional regulator